MQVYCKGEHVLTVSGTQPEYKVDIWSGNHPFFLGQTSAVVVDDGRVNKFKRKFEGMDFLIGSADSDSAVADGAKEEK